MKSLRVLLSHLGCRLSTPTQRVRIPLYIHSNIMALLTSRSFWVNSRAFLPLAVAISLRILVQKSLYFCLVKPPTATRPPETPFRHRHLVYKTSERVRCQPAHNIPEQCPIAITRTLARCAHRHCKTLMRITWTKPLLYMMVDLLVRQGSRPRSRQCPHG